MKTVKEVLARYPSCSKSSFYQKIRRHLDKELQGHISKDKNGDMLLDDFAVDFLKPARIKNAELLDAASKNDKAKISDLKLQIIELENEKDDLSDRLLQSFNDSYEKCKSLQEEIDFLKSENEKLKSQLAEFENAKSKNPFERFIKSKN